MNPADSGKSPSAASTGGGLSDLQFDRAEPLSTTSNSGCTICGSPIAGTYYTAYGSKVCPACATIQGASGSIKPSKSDFIKAILFGSAAAIAGTAVYYGVLALTGYEIGWIAVGVGWLVGKAVHKGSRGIGGRRLQLIAVVLTYLSIVGSYAPPIIQYVINQPQTVSPSLPGIVIGFVILIAYCMALPFTQGLSSILGLFIICIGLFEAWKLNQRAPAFIEGPFQVPGTASAA